MKHLPRKLLHLVVPLHLTAAGEDLLNELLRVRQAAVDHGQHRTPGRDEPQIERLAQALSGARRSRNFPVKYMAIAELHQGVNQVEAPAES